MGKETVVIMRTGSPLWLGMGGSCGGEQGDTEGIVNYLADSGRYNVVVFGLVKGQPREDITVIQPNMEGIDDLSTCAAIDECVLFAVQQLRELNPKVCINNVGACPTLSWLGNPWGVGSQSFAVRYVYPAMRAIAELKLPRVCVVNDPRQYPRDHEMVVWPSCRPVAVLSQIDDVFGRSIRGNKYEIHSVHARAENWWSYGRTPVYKETRTGVPCTVVAHSHMEDGRLKRHRDEVWKRILSSMCTYNDDALDTVSEPKDPFEYDKRLVVYGKGWDTYSRYNASTMPGPVKGPNVNDLLSDAWCGPCIPVAERFLTGKLRVYALAGCLPLPYGQGDDILKYDPTHVYVSDHDMIRCTDNLNALVNLFGFGSDLHKNWVNEILNKTQPDFSRLVSCIEDLLRMTDQIPTQSEAWLNQYGGYACLG